MEFNNIAGPGNPNPRGCYAHSTHNDLIAALFLDVLIVRPFVQGIPLNSQNIFLPMLLEMNQPPLTRAKDIMLNL